jgi:glucosylglycerate synthase
MVSHYRQGLTDLGPIWHQILSNDSVSRMRDLQGTAGTDCRIPDELWVQIVYDAATAYHKRIMPRDHLLKALTPLYLGRTASFVQATQGLTSKEAEHKIEALCRTFEHMKPYLVERWQPPALQSMTPALLHHTTAAAGGDHE